jgi:PEP-CTERM motif
MNKTKLQVLAPVVLVAAAIGGTAWLMSSGKDNAVQAASTQQIVPIGSGDILITRLASADGVKPAVVVDESPSIYDEGPRPDDLKRSAPVRLYDPLAKRSGGDASNPAASILSAMPSTDSALAAAVEAASANAAAPQDGTAVQSPNGIGFAQNSTPIRSLMMSPSSRTLVTQRMVTPEFGAGTSSGITLDPKAPPVVPIPSAAPSPTSSSPAPAGPAANPSAPDPTNPGPTPPSAAPDPTPSVPEPATLGLLGLALLGVAGAKRRARRS